uniref:F-box domain-containing protein n=1 Tax=Helianthus annuus TaxID=4232 RepID=A0A251VSI7_HELAN
MVKLTIRNDLISITILASLLSVCYQLKPAHRLCTTVFRRASAATILSHHLRPLNSEDQARSVSKAWKSVIDSPDFIADYTVHNHDQPQHLLIRYENLYSVETYVSFVDDDSFPQNKYSPTVPRSVNLLSDSIIIGASHGLVCLFGCYLNPGRSR